MFGASRLLMCTVDIIFRKLDLCDASRNFGQAIIRPSSRYCFLRFSFISNSLSQFNMEWVK